GAIIDIEISLPQALVDLYTKQGKPLPQSVAGLALIDTGATKSCVHDAIMQQLEVNATGVATSQTAYGPRQCNLYPAHFRFPSAQIDIEFNSVMEVDLTGQIVNGQQLIALIGRDVLSRTVFTYNGPMGMYTLSM